jgi:aspartate carbamoyltransferase regulatory subunit
MQTTLGVAAIENGTVIDHIDAGQALRIIYLLNLAPARQLVTIGLQLPSKRMGTKDLIKIDTRLLTAAESNEVAVFAPHATINIIKKFLVVEKSKTVMPAKIQGVFPCPNSACITSTEPITSCFNIITTHKHIQLSCYYCQQVYQRDQLKMAI